MTRLEIPAQRRKGGVPRWPKETFGADLGASLVVFLVAVPLCVGVAVASGVPAELGIVTGIVGGLLVGLLPGSTMQVSGPAAGLTVLVASAVDQHGLAALGVIVLGAGVLQILLGISRLGTWFRAISPSVVQGMLAGIGLVLILGQIYPVGGLAQPETTLAKFSGIPDLLVAMVTTPAGVSGLALAGLALLIMAFWKKAPQKVRLVPGALAAVVITSALAVLLALPVHKVEVGSLLAALNPPAFSAWGSLLDPAVLGSIVTFALIASAESLFSAAAVDRMHDGPKTQYNKELVAQGVGNTVCGVFGALPMTAVIVRSSANVQAGAKTKLSRVMHGGWLLLFVVLLPGVLSFIPTAVLAALLIQAGWKLLELRQVAVLVRENRSEAFVLILTAGMIVATDLLIGTLAGLAVAIVKTAIEVSRLSVKAEDDAEQVRVELGGNATFLRLPRLLDHLEKLPAGKHVHLDLTMVRHLDRACHQAVEHWAAQRRRSDGTVEVALPARVG
ncbi:Sulfate permease, MFS superfamily [Saccharopolyspora kobensis]|uniref:Sulfate permease, MFS superfamily n=1 Tax=Saccharopolyspora kobensis TaxID=146035 RepID=A0A1H6CDH2_9PSEU|nr:SulP family inorganic anion transporter [Saccharopolyspora kobensis]SEG71059.1 Sulfate permease, MFS superfamily [Saccharopolyspora kobensis]SFC36784.1 Sulfate permease, MFS superfamily [Saccharopolyspora kobensis]